ncbi:MAG: DegT/DnrJ/EryC1/StrS family aminotransferase [Acidimicrobiia bacterium]|nr:DegT/DnrJ/EryC1/StrS family aminotransferase [Acidimicrobiia bacterium]
MATGVHYPVPLHLQPAYRHLGYGRGDLPVAERLAGAIVSLPLYPRAHRGPGRRGEQAVRSLPPRG